MCGITGFIDFKNSSNEDVLKRMTDVLQHRGPDGAGYHFSSDNTQQIGLGHRRLSIIDLSNHASQPMFFKHWSIVFNGEIYNFQELRAELIALNHQFITNSDTEVILHAFAEWGIQCISKFIGMFAFVIYDAEKQEIYCVRDRAGVKPFYYYWDGQLFLFASELKSFHQHPNFKKEIDIHAVASFMQYGHIPTPNCIFKNCYKLQAGHFLVFNLNSKNFEIKKYWNVYDAYNKPKLDISFQEAKFETEKILSSAFQYRMVADVPVGVFLSGGYDSACVTALLQRQNNTPLKTFTIAVPDIGLNEAPYAKDISKHLGTEHHEMECSSKEALELINSLPFYYDEPFGDQSAIPTSLVCKMAKEHVTVALSADAGDEIFAGYNRYDYLIRYGNKLNSMPKVLRKSVSHLMDMIKADSIPVLKNSYNFPNRYEKLKKLLLNPSHQNIMLSLSQQFTNEEINNLFIKKINTLHNAYISTELKKEFYTPLSYMMAIDYQTYLLDDILQKVDRASMSASLEGREPFLDHRIIEWAAQLPDNYKYHHGEKKYILKEIVHQYIPKSLMDRPKMGFAIPIEKWLMEDLKDKVFYYTEEKLIIEQGIFNIEIIRKLKHHFYTLGKKEYALKIWYLLIFQMWHEKWMSN